MPLSYVATSKEYGDGKGGTTWKAMREERPVTPNFDPIRQAIKSVSGSCTFVWLSTKVHGLKKTEVNTRHSNRHTCDLKHDPISAWPRAPWLFLKVQTSTKRVQHTLGREVTPVTLIASTQPRWPRQSYQRRLPVSQVPTSRPDLAAELS